MLESGLSKPLASCCCRIERAIDLRQSRPPIHATNTRTSPSDRRRVRCRMRSRSDHFASPTVGPCISLHAARRPTGVPKGNCRDRHEQITSIPRPERRHLDGCRLDQQPVVAAVSRAFRVFSVMIVVFCRQSAVARRHILSPAPPRGIIKRHHSRRVYAV
jgi:hypothetical protein